MSNGNGETPPWEGKRSGSAKSLLRRLVPWLIGGALVAVVAMGLKPKPVEVETGTVARAPLTVRISEEGKTRIRNRYVVAAPLAGRMRRVHFKAGDEVKAGETLLTAIEPVAAPLLDPRAKALAEAIVATREAARSRATETLKAAQSAQLMADANLARIHSLRGGAVSQADRDRAEMEGSMRSADVRAAEFALKVAEHEIAQAHAALDRPAVTIEGNAIEVKAPVSGRLLNVMQESETVVTAGTPIAEIGDPADIEIEAEILSRDAVAMKPGDAVSIEQWGGPQPLAARVRRIEPAAFTKISALGVEEQRVFVLCDLVNPPEEAKALGDRYRVEVRVAVWHSDDALVVPAGALFREGNAWKTFVFRDGKAQAVSLEAGKSDGHFTDVISGLSEGDEVLLHPPDTVKDGTAVTKRK
ncbi:HlyD family efflux transporter periplasmic adaptor subunit [Luteolibacter arcticus]|uniref:HlyD family efflux transporter periplasmic adaptor subunit n=1 Tax=Luteolibacter arcticus TaxID=1581411 RepID=A0ABT3GEH7_9BACT|nr:HlyD family efflux transporter periplasmic adaptor subunit [Luteolibacter arcticus]MCW1922020.1 HlyD family efflux transporter periplasmic adaptor subunit [Luteolibacter arcticus]